MTKKFDNEDANEGKRASTEDSDDFDWQKEGIGRGDDNATPGHPGDSLEVEPNSEDITTQFSPSLPKDLIKTSHIFGDIKYKNKPTKRGEFSKFVENTMKNHILIYFLLHPSKYNELHENIELEPAVISENIEGYMKETRAGVAEALLNLPDEIKKQGSHPADVMNPEKDNLDTKVQAFIDSGYSNQSTANDDRRAIGATVSQKLSDTYKDVVRVAHNGNFRGYFSQFAETGLKYNIILTCLRETDIRGKIQASDDVENPDKILENISNYADLVAQDLADAHRVMPKEIEERVSTPSPMGDIFDTNDERHQKADSVDKSENNKLLNKFRESVQADGRITTNSSTEESLKEVLGSNLREVISSEGEPDEELIPEHLVTEEEKNRIEDSREKRKSGEKREDNRFTKKLGRTASKTRSGDELEPIIKRFHIFGYLLKHIEDTGQDVGELSEDEFQFAENIIEDEMSDYFDRAELETAFEKIYKNKADFFELLENTHKISTE